MNRLNFSKGASNGHLLEQGGARAIGWISRFTLRLQQAISNLEFLGLATGTVANMTLLLSLLQHQTATSVQKGVI